MNLTKLSYGGSCTYKVQAKCGLPNIVVNNTNVDMLVTYKKDQWSNDSYAPDKNTTFSTDEAFSV